MDTSNRLRNYIARLESVPDNELIQMAQPYADIYNFNKSDLTDPIYHLQSELYITACSNQLIGRIYKQYIDSMVIYNNATDREKSAFTYFLNAISINVTIKDTILEHVAEAVGHMATAYHIEFLMEHYDKVLSLGVSRFELIKTELARRKINLKISKKVKLDSLITSKPVCERSVSGCNQLHILKHIDYLNNNIEIFNEIIANAGLNIVILPEHLPDQIIISLNYKVKFEKACRKMRT